MTEKQLCKRALIAIIIWTVISVLIVIGTNLIATATHTRVEDYNTYVLHGQVVDVNKEEDAVACADYDGNLWEFYGVEDWKKGDFVTMIMDTCGTTNIFDDEIVKVEYNGNVEGLK